MFIVVTDFLSITLVLSLSRLFESPFILFHFYFVFIHRTATIVSCTASFIESTLWEIVFTVCADSIVVSSSTTNVYGKSLQYYILVSQKCSMYTALSLYQFDHAFCLRVAMQPSCTCKKALACVCVPTNMLRLISQLA